jgi:DNA modification methylase
MAAQHKIPYTQQFAPEQTPLLRLLAIIRQHEGRASKLREAIGSAFFKRTKSPEKMAKNTLIALRNYGILSSDCALTVFGARLLELQGDAKAVHEELAKHALLNLDGVMLVETLREMKQANMEFSLVSLTKELRQRGFDVSDNSSDLSGVLGWLRAAGVLADYDVVEEVYGRIVGSAPKTIDALKNLAPDQINFLRAMTALSVTDWTPYSGVVGHAEMLYPGQVSYNWKEIDRTILQPLSKAGFIEVRKRLKSTSGARGGKTADVRPTERFNSEVAEPILEPMYRAAGYRKVREIRSIPFAKIVEDVRQRKDADARARALEILAIRVCQLLDLDFMGWRETDEVIAAGGEVDGFMHSARLVYSRWQIQCKASEKVAIDALAKEVGISEISLANVILIVSTGRLTDGAETYRRKIVSTKPLNIAVVDGRALDEIAKSPASITSILSGQAQDAMKIKPSPQELLLRTRGRNGESNGGSQASKTRALDSKPDRQAKLFKPYYSTGLGQMYLGDSYDVLHYLIREGVRVKLIVTSPPFALIRKKEYGNEAADVYVDWFMQFAPLFERILLPEGSLVVDIGGAWIPGIPAKSTYHFKLLLRLCESGFYLAQDFYHYNPARLPTPAEWVTIRRLRVKDAVNNVWWFVRDPFADADNRRVLREYSDSMKDLLKNGYKPKLRPSGHDISDKFQNDRGGAIPPNLLQFANTESNSHYLLACREAGIKPHPARFPIGLPKFFVNFLTRPGDLVLDPFAGSNTAGEAAQLLGRRWIGIEKSEDYVKGSQFRFTPSSSAEEPTTVTRAKAAPHALSLPFAQ